MNIKEQFNFVAQEYDANRKKFIPCFDDYYENTTNGPMSRHWTQKVELFYAASIASSSTC